MNALLMLLVGLTAAERVIVSFTTMHSRAPYIGPMLRSLGAQSRRPDEIRCYSELEEKDFGPKTMHWAQKVGVSFRYADPALRSYKKLIPCMHEEQASASLIITVDDDWVYRRTLIEELLATREAFHAHYDGHVIVCDRGKRIDGPDYNAWKMSRSNPLRPHETCALSGSGMLVEPGVFGRDVFERDAFLALAPTADDLWWTANALAAGTALLAQSREDDHPLQSEIRSGGPTLYQTNIYKNSATWSALMGHLERKGANPNDLIATQAAPRADSEPSWLVSRGRFDPSLVAHREERGEIRERFDEFTPENDREAYDAVHNFLWRTAGGTVLEITPPGAVGSVSRGLVEVGWQRVLIDTGQDDAHQEQLDAARVKSRICADRQTTGGNCVSLGRVLVALFVSHVDLLIVKAGDTGLVALESVDWSLVTFSVICVGTDRPGPAATFLGERGYTRVGERPDAAWFVAKGFRPAQSPKADLLTQGYRSGVFDVIGYWENRYASGTNSGSGSYGRVAEYKREKLCELIPRLRVRSIVDLGVGDGNVLSLLERDKCIASVAYSGVDVSRTTVARLRGRFPGLRFVTYGGTVETFWATNTDAADVAMSLEVIFHLVDDSVFESYMDVLWQASSRYIVVFSSTTEDKRDPGRHVRHRNWLDWMRQRHRGEFFVLESDLLPLPEDSFSDWHVLEKTQ